MISEILTAAFLVIGALTTLIGTIGLLRLPRFLERAHATTLGTTLATACVALASVIHFSAVAGSPVLHGVLIIVFITVTTPIGLIVLVRAARLRDATENDRMATPAAESERR